MGDTYPLTELSLPGYGLSGTLPPELGGNWQLTAIDLSDNLLSGSLPAQLSNLYSLQTLDLRNNQLSGSLPALPISGFEWQSLQTLDLRGNRFAYPRSSEERGEYDIATSICRGAGATCLGIPPNGCTAFEGAIPSIADPNECVLCDTFITGLIVIGVCILVGLVFLAVAVRFIVRHPNIMKRWVSSASILLNHAQTASIIASMRMRWPSSLRASASALKLDLFMLPSASCLISANTGYATSALLGSPATR